MTSLSDSRRHFLRFLAASPLLAELWAQEPSAPAITSPKEALDVMDFEQIAHRVLPPAHWGYMSSGVDDDLTLKANIAAYKHIQLRPHRLVDVSKTDLKIELFGTTFDSPIFICPVGGHKMFHPQGEIATAKAARSKNALQILSTQTSTPVEDVVQARGSSLWYQLYMPTHWEDTEKLVRRVEAAGCPVMAWTVDLFGGRNTETFSRFQRMDTRDCSTCHTVGPGGRIGRGSGRAPMFVGLSGSGINPPTASWSDVDRLKKLTRMKLLLKGIETGEDARLAVEHGVDGLIVSNHGGRATEDLRATVDSLPEVLDAVRGRIPVLVDGGVRRGSDAYKALALGAKAVGIGRPYTWGLAAFGELGVERVLDILNAELQRTMRQCGTPTIEQITSSSVRVMKA
jgi:4-hydroxymandelate oxidase